METIEWNDFSNVQLRVVIGVAADAFAKTRKPAYIMQVDFGEEIDMHKSNALLTTLYRAESLIGKPVVASVNFPPNQINPIMCERLMTGSLNVATTLANH